VVIEGDDVDLTKLPIPLQFTVDGAPYITAGQISARDPVSGVDTTGFHRLMLRGRNRLGVSLHSLMINCASRSGQHNTARTNNAAQPACALVFF
jgi:UbiD family decarboxylase